MAQFEELTIKIRKETADSLRRIKESSVISEGEILERAFMEFRAEDSKVAPIILLQDLNVLLSKLDEKEAGKAYIDIVLTLLSNKESILENIIFLI